MRTRPGTASAGRRASCRPTVAGAREQQGIALVAMMLVLLLAGGAVLIENLNNRMAGRVENAQPTGAALRLARTALIAYAATDANRPGELPCPDLNRDGVLTVGVDIVGPNCAVLRGWLPWRTLDIPDLRDASGARLWYALSDAYHATGPIAGAVPLNPSTPGGLSLDGSTPPADPDIVAVLIAPGEAAANQSRPPDAAAAADVDVGEYLEEINADGTETTYASTGGVDFNDRVLAVPRVMLMAAVQKRVAAEVARVFEQHRLVHVRYPWLSTFEAPATSNFATDFGVTAGQLAFTDTRTTTAEPTFAFDTALDLTWAAGDAAKTTAAPVIVSSDPTATPPHFQLEDAAQLATMTVAGQVALAGEDGPEGGTWSAAYPATAGGGVTCNWGGANEVVDCDLITSAIVDPGYNVRVCRNVAGTPPLQCDSRPVSRRFQFELHYEGSVTGWSSDAGVRVRTVDDSDGNMTVPGPPTIVRVVDTVVLPPMLPFFTDTGTVTVTSKLTVVDGNTSTFTVARLYTEPQSPPYDPDPVLCPLCVPPTDNSDLPPWFAENGWAQFVYASYASGFSPTGGGICTAGSNCVAVSVADVAGVVNDANAVVVMSGELGPAQALTLATLGGAGFEEDNADGNGLLMERKTRTATFNDHLLMVTCNSGPCR